MPHTRIIARLDIKGPNLIKGIHLEGLRVMGDPNEHAQRYYEAGADELLYMDTVASLYGRNNLTKVVSYTARNIFIPFTVGGGIRSIDDISALLRAGADKVAINTAAVKRPDLLKEAALHFGAQCIVLSIEAKQLPNGGWEAYTDNGREHTGLDVIEWAGQGVEYGAGEILLTSVDQEGTARGMDVELIQTIAQQVSVPVIASGGAGTLKHIENAVQAGADAVALANILHYQHTTMKEIKNSLADKGISIRNP